MIIAIKLFKIQQQKEYLEYCEACKKNNITPADKDRYFWVPTVNYGYIIKNNVGEITWRKRKQDFNI